MKREIIPGRFILLILAAFLAIMVLPIVLASLSGQLDLPVEQSYAGVTVPLVGLPAGEAETLQLLCRSQDGGPAEETRVAFQFLPGADGALTLRVYPEKADLLNVNFRYEYSPSA